MKMSKIMAAGIAATLAVTSLASVASAEVAREFDMKYSSGVWVYDGEITGAKSEQLGDDFKFVTPVAGGGVGGATVADTYALANLAEVNFDTNLDTVVDYQDFDGFIPVIVAGTAPIETMGDLTITVEGRKYDNGNLVTRTQKINLIKVNSVRLDGVASGANYVLPIYKGTSPVDAFLPEEFSAVDKITVSAGSVKSIVLAGLEYSDYKYIYDLVAASNAPTLKTSAVNREIKVQAKGAANWYDGDLKNAAVSVRNTAAAATLSVNLAAANYLTTQLYYEVSGAAKNANGGLDLSGTAKAYVAPVPTGTGSPLGDNLIKEINTLMKGGLTATWKAKATGTIVDNVAWMPITTIVDANHNAAIIERDEVKLLSDTRDYTSQNIWSAANTDIAYQTYNVTDYNQGTIPKGFAGLSSQVADFFNHQTNGKITFHFAAKVDNANSLTWNNGGIPSTEVGLRNFLDAAKAKDFALFVNYNATTGSLQSDAVLDPYASSITFDISSTLQALGGQTIGTVQDLYYALANGASQNNGIWGLWVDKVVLSYDETAKADTAAAAEDEKEETVKEEPKADDKAETVEVEIPDDTEEPDDDATVVIEEPDDAATVVDNTADNTVVVNSDTTTVTPSNTVAPAADENPHTGVALAVVPAALAAAAMVISKKRK